MDLSNLSVSFYVLVPAPWGETRRYVCFRHAMERTAKRQTIENVVDDGYHGCHDCAGLDDPREED